MKLDILIVDIDDTFIYHQTVASANQLALIYVHRFFREDFRAEKLYSARDALCCAFSVMFRRFFRIFIFKVNMEYFTKLWILFFAFLRLYALHAYRHAFNLISDAHEIKSSERMIKLWADTLVLLKVNPWDYELSKKVLNSSVYTDRLDILKNLRRNNPSLKVIAISESLSCEIIGKIIGADNVICNQLVVKKGIVTGYKLNVKNGVDKKYVAEKFVKRKSKIGLMIDDYDDVALLGLQGIALVYHKKKLSRFIRKDICSYTF